MGDLKDRIVIDPGVCNGKPVIRGTRVTAETVLGFLSAGDSADEVLQNYPQLTAEDIRACLDFAARIAGHTFSAAKTA